MLLPQVPNRLSLLALSMVVRLCSSATSSLTACKPPVQLDTPNVTAFCVLNLSSVDNSPSIFGDTGSGGSWSWDCGNGDGYPRTLRKGQSLIGRSNTALAVGQATLISADYEMSSGLWHHYLNGVLDGSGTQTGAAFTAGETQLLAGYSPGAGNWSFSGQMAEVIRYDRVLTTTERQQVEVYLGSKWGTPAVINRGESYTAQGVQVSGMLAWSHAAFTPAAGSLLVAMPSIQAKNDGVSVTTVTLQPSDTFGDTGGTAWVRSATCFRPASGSSVYLETVDIWTRKVGTSPGSGVITVAGTINGSSGNNTRHLRLALPGHRSVRSPATTLQHRLVRSVRPHHSQACPRSMWCWVLHLRLTRSCSAIFHRIILGAEGTPRRLDSPFSTISTTLLTGRRSSPGPTRAAVLRRLSHGVSHRLATGSWPVPSRSRLPVLQPLPSPPLVTQPGTSTPNRRSLATRSCTHQGRVHALSPLTQAWSTATCWCSSLPP